jgi:hypothetical protein
MLKLAQREREKIRMKKPVRDTRANLGPSLRHSSTSTEDSEAVAPNAKDHGVPSHDVPSSYLLNAAQCEKREKTRTPASLPLSL